MRASLALAGLCVLLAGALSLEVLLPAASDPGSVESDIRPAPRLPRLDPARAAAQSIDHSDAWVATILARPLFSRDRRPPDVKVAAAADSTEGPPRLAGIAIGPALRSAIFAAAAGGKPVVVGVGGSIGGFTVRAIEPGRVQLVGPGGARTLSPAFDPTLAVAATDVVPRPPGFPVMPLIPGQPLQLPGRPFLPPRFNGLPYNTPGRFNPAGDAAAAQP